MITIEEMEQIFVEIFSKYDLMKIKNNTDTIFDFAERIFEDDQKNYLKYYNKCSSKYYDLKACVYSMYLFESTLPINLEILQMFYRFLNMYFYDTPQNNLDGIKFLHILNFPYTSDIIDFYKNTRSDNNYINLVELLEEDCEFNAKIRFDIKIFNKLLVISNIFYMLKFDVYFLCSTIEIDKRNFPFYKSKCYKMGEKYNIIINEKYHNDVNLYDEFLKNPEYLLFNDVQIYIYRSKNDSM
jgi:hypothetical protein